MNTTPDYGWSCAQSESSFSYLEPVVLHCIETARKAFTGISGPLRVFDAGCGNGALLANLKQMGFTVGGCDSSASGIEIARRSLGDGPPLAQLSVYEDLKGRFGNAWDVVVTTEVIEHLYAPRDFVRRAHDLLRPGGYLVISTPYHGYFKNLAMAAMGSFDTHFTALWDGGHIKFWSYSTLTALLREAGFANFRFSGAGRLPWLWKSMVVMCERAD